MDVSIWWVVAACFVGVSIGFVLCAALVIAKDEDAREPAVVPGPNAHTVM